MKIIYKTGDLIAAPEHIIVHGCNNRGAMNSGVAKAMREAYPEAYGSYRHTSPLVLGEIIVVEYSDRMVINAITQDGYGYDGARYVSYDAVAACFERIARVPLVKELGVVAMPKIGAGLGGGDWNIISATIEATLGDIQAVVYIMQKAYMPQDWTDEQIKAFTDKWNSQPGNVFCQFERKPNQPPKLAAINDELAVLFPPKPL